MTKKQDRIDRPFLTEHVHPMTRPEIDQFLSCAPVGRIGVSTEDGPYIIPVGFCYFQGKIFIHMCGEGGRKIPAIESNPNVCFEVDEYISDISLAKSVMIMGRAEIISDEKSMIPHLQRLINKYRVPVSFREYATKKNREALALKLYGKPELEILRICCITPHEITGRSIIRANSNF